MSTSAKEFNPFPGLRPFEMDEYKIFFGRESQSDELIKRLGRTRFLAVVGTSGSGKSSLVRAGLLPALRGGLMARRGSAWRIAIMRPGHDPIANLADALAAEGVLEEAGGGLRGAEAEAVIEATLRRGTLGLVEATRQAHLGPRHNLLVVVDQFEEIFRFRDKQDVDETTAAAFVKLLLEVSSQHEQNVYVVLTMRSDFLGDCSQFQGLPEAINEGQYLVPRMTREERRSAITGPAVVADASIAEPLVSRLLNDVGDNPDQLPILQHALMRTWEHRASRATDGEPVGLEDYEAVGTMSDALSRHAEEAYGELGAEKQAGQEQQEEQEKQSERRRIAEVLFKSLTERGADNREIRRPTRLSEICAAAGATEDEVKAVIEVFRRKGRSFLMPPEGVALRPDTIIDISHESLIRIWKRLEKWVNDEAESARTFRRLADAAAFGNDLTGSALDTALDWRARHRPNEAWAERYVEAFGLQAGYEQVSAFIDRSKSLRDAAAEAERARVEAEERRRREEAEREKRDLENAAALAEKERRLAETERQRAEEQAAAKQRELEQARAAAERQARDARKMRMLTVALAILLLLAVGTAVYAMRAQSAAQQSEARAVEAKSEAEKQKAEAERQKAEVEKQKGAAEKAKEEADAAKVEAQGQRDLAKGNEKKAVEALKKADAATKLANEQERIAKEEARRANEQEGRAKSEAIRTALNAEALRKEFKFTADSRAAAAALRRGELDLAQAKLTQLAYDFYGDQPKLIWVYSNLGAAQHRQGNDVDSEQSYFIARNLYEQRIKGLNVVGAKGAEVSEIEYLDILKGLAQFYEDNGKYDKAEPLYKDTLDINEKALGPEHQETASSLEALAANYKSQGMSEKAEPLYERALAIRRKRAESLDLINSLTAAADFYADESKPREALRLYKEVLAIQENRLTGDDPKMADIYSNLARAYRDAEPRKWADVADRLDKLAQQIRSRNRNSAYYKDLANMYIRLRKYQQAQPLAMDAERLYMPPDMASTSEEAEADIGFANLHRAAGSFSNAEAAFKKVIDRTGLADNDPTKRKALEGLASLYQDDGRYDDAVALYEKASGTYPSEGERDDQQKLNAATTLVRLALTYFDKGDAAAGERRLNDALRAATTGRPADCVNDDEDPAIESPCNRFFAFAIIVNTYLADHYRKQGKLDEADALYKKVLEVVTQKPVSDNSPGKPLRLRPGVLTYFSRSHRELLPAFVEAARFSLKRGGVAAAEQFYYMATAASQQEAGSYVSATVEPTLKAYDEYADLLDRTGRAAEAKQKREAAERLKSTVEQNENPLP